jgi:hypothetical protein
VIVHHLNVVSEGAWSSSRANMIQRKNRASAPELYFVKGRISSAAEAEISACANGTA